MNCPTCHRDQAYRFCTDRFHSDYENPMVKELKSVLDRITKYPGQ